MPRLDVYRTPSRNGSGHVLDVQAESLSHLGTRAVMPLAPQAGAPMPVRELNPVCDLDGAPHVMVTQAIASVPARELRRAVASLDSRHDDITRALDILLVGCRTKTSPALAAVTPRSHSVPTLAPAAPRRH